MIVVSSTLRSQRLSLAKSPSVESRLSVSSSPSLLSATYLDASQYLHRSSNPTKPHVIPLCDFRIHKHATGPLRCSSDFYGLRLTALVVWTMALAAGSDRWCPNDLIGQALCSVRALCGGPTKTSAARLVRERFVY